MPSPSWSVIYLSAMEARESHHRLRDGLLIGTGLDWSDHSPANRLAGLAGHDHFVGCAVAVDGQPEYLRGAQAEHGPVAKRKRAPRQRLGELLGEGQQRRVAFEPGIDELAATASARPTWSTTRGGVFGGA